MSRKIIITTTVTMLLATIASHAQLLKRLEKSITNKVEQKIDDKLNEAINGNREARRPSSDTAIIDVPSSRSGTAYEYQRGSNVLFQDNFASTPIDDFPEGWNTTLSGEVVNHHGVKYLKIPAAAVTNMILNRKLPNDFILEYDMIIPSEAPIRMAGVGIGAKPRNIDYLLVPSEALHIAFHSRKDGHDEGIKYGREGFTTGAGLTKIAYNIPLDRPIKVALIVKGRSLKLIVDGMKILDMPSVMDDYLKNAIYFCASTHGAKESLYNYFLIGNVVITANEKVISKVE